MRVVFGSRGRRVRRRRRGPFRLRGCVSGRVRPGADACTDCVARTDRHTDLSTDAWPDDYRADRVGRSDVSAELFADVDPDRVGTADAGAYAFAELCADVGSDLRADAVAYVFTELRADRVGWSDIRAERLPDSVAFFYADPLANAIAYVFAELLADVAPELRADVFAEPSADVGSDHDTCPEQRADRVLRLAGNFEVRG